MKLFLQLYRPRAITLPLAAHARRGVKSGGYGEGGSSKMKDPCTHISTTPLHDFLSINCLVYVRGESGAVLDFCRGVSLGLRRGSLSV